MIVPKAAVKQRTSVMVLALILLVFGVYSYNTLPRESAPDISIPYVFVSTDYAGVAAADIETSITIPIEKKLRGMRGVKRLKSISSEGLSQINVEFLPDVDINDALQDVRNKVDEAKGDLPADLEDDPVVFEVNISELPIAVFSLSGTAGIARLKEMADDLKDVIEAIAGVLEVEITGGLEREIIVEMNPDKLTYYRIPITAFQEAVTRENLNTSGGSIKLGHGKYQLQVPGEFSTPEEINLLVVATVNGRPIYLKDVARVIDGFKEESSRSRIDGVPAVNIAVKKRAGENIIDISDDIERAIEQQRAGWPPGTQITKTMDAAKDIRMMVADLENNILSGLVLVVVVLFFALGARNAIMVAMAIPFSMLISFTVLYALGITLNMVVLFSQLVARGYAAKEAIIAAGATRLRPVLLTAVTTILGLIPMVTGVSYDFRNFTLSLVSESSQWWRSMAIVVIFGLLVATFLTLVVVPVLYSLNHSLQQVLRRTLQRMRETSTRA